MKSAKIATALFALLAGATMSSNAIAATKWERNHPRRDQVNDRVAHQDRRIAAERREGDLTKGQAQGLRQSDRSIRLQQRADARANGGYITKAQQRTLNQELNANSKAIGK
jgi:hypothetical protein